MTTLVNWIICALVVTVCIQLVIIRYYRLHTADLRRELADATDWMDPIVIGEPSDDDEF